MAVVAPEWPIPQAVPTKKITKRGLQRTQETILLRHAEPMLQETFEALRKRIRAGDASAIKMSLEINNMVRAAGGMTVTNNIMQGNFNRAEANAGGEGRKNFESLVRKLEARPIQTSRMQDFIDVEAED